MSFGAGAFGAHPYGLANDEGPPPLVLNWTPILNSQIARLDVIGFEVLSPLGLEQVIARAIFRSGASEVIYDHTAAMQFEALYRRGSAARIIGDGLRFIVRRTGGWPSADIRFHVTARDIAGRVTVGQAVFS